MNKRTNSKENDTISKKTGNKARQLSIYFFQAISLIALLFCVWLLTREKEYREIDVNTVAQNLVELMPDTVVSESDMVVKERFGLEANAFNGLVYYGPDSNMEAAELLLVNLKDISQKESVEEAIQKRIEYQKSCFEGYGVDQMELINNAMTITYGHYMLFIVSNASLASELSFDTIKNIYVFYSIKGQLTGKRCNCRCDSQIKSQIGEEDNNGIFKYDFFICISACCGFGVHA